MKKKLTAVLLTLCMVLGMLPMSAFAAWYTAETDGKEVTFTGTVGTDVDGNKYYVKEVVEGDTLTYYTNEALTTGKGTLYWVDDEGNETKEITTVAVTLSASTAQVGDEVSSITASTKTEGVVRVEITGWTLTVADGEPEAFTGETFQEAGTYTATVEATAEEGYVIADECEYTGDLTVTVEAPTEIPVTGTVGEDGVIEASVSSTQVNDALKTAESEQTVVINVTASASGTVNGIAVTLDEGAVSALAEHGGNVEVKSDAASVNLPGALVGTLKGNVELKVAPTTIENPAEDSDAAKVAEVETAVVLDLSLTAGGKNVDFDGNTVTVTVKTDLNPSSKNPIVVYYIDDNGAAELKATIIESTEDGEISWTTTHFSTWAYMMKDDAEAAGLDVVEPNPPIDEDLLQAFPEANVTNNGLGKVYTVSVTGGQDVLYQVMDANKNVLSITLLDNPGTDVQISVRATDIILAYVGTNINWNGTGDFFTYDSITAAYDSRLKA